MILKVKTKEGYAFKVLSEFLQCSLQDVCFVFNQNGIFLMGIDKSEYSTELIDLKLLKENFISYTCVPSSINVGVNPEHFYKMLKSIKKKDSLVLFIDESRPLDLGIKIQQNGESNPSVSYVKITTISPICSDIPEGYDFPIRTTPKEFQKLKTLNKISKTITLSSYKRRIMFSCDKEGVYARSVPLGEEEDDSDDEIVQQDDKFEQKFRTEQIIKLIKMAGMSSIIPIYAKKNLPLKITMNIGTLGNITIYIKSAELIDDEKENGDVPQKL
jgi:hypothetical protein